MRRVRRWAGVALAAVLVAMPGTSSAQQRRDGTPDRAQIEQRIRAQMGRMMQERLGLDDAEAAKLSEVVRTFDGRREALRRSEEETRRRVAEITTSGGDEAEARQLLERQAELRLQEAQLFADEQDALLGVLTPAQVLELQDLRQDVGRRIRALRSPRGDGPRDGNRAGPRGPGPRSDGRIGERRHAPAGPPA